MTLGVPVVAANRGALPEVLGDAGLLVEPEDAAKMAEAIVRIARGCCVCGIVLVERRAAFASVPLVRYGGTRYRGLSACDCAPRDA